MQDIKIIVANEDTAEELENKLNNLARQGYKRGTLLLSGIVERF